MAPPRKAEYETTCPKCGQIFDVGDSESDVACPSCSTRIRLTDEPRRLHRPVLALLVGTLAPLASCGAIYLLLSDWFQEWERGVPVEEWMVVTGGAVAAVVGLAIAIWNGFDRDGWRLAFGLFLLGPAGLALNSVWGAFGDFVQRFGALVMVIVVGGFAVASLVLWLRKRSATVAGHVQRTGIAAVVALAATCMALAGLALWVAASFP